LFYWAKISTGQYMTKNYIEILVNTFCTQMYYFSALLLLTVIESTIEVDNSSKQVNSGKDIVVWIVRSKLCSMLSSHLSDHMVNVEAAEVTAHRRA
jgi:hypothetical protein